MYLNNHAVPVFSRPFLRMMVNPAALVFSIGGALCFSRLVNAFAPHNQFIGSRLLADGSVSLGTYMGICVFGYIGGETFGQAGAFVDFKINHGDNHDRKSGMTFAKLLGCVGAIGGGMVGAGFDFGLVSTLITEGYQKAAVESTASHMKPPVRLEMKAGITYAVVPAVG